MRRGVYLAWREDSTERRVVPPTMVRGRHIRRGVPPTMVPGRLCRKDTTLCTREAMQEGYPTLCTPPYVHPVYTPPGIYTLYTPGYTTILSCTPSTSALATSLPGRRALGSKQEKGLGRRLSFLLRS